MRLLCICFLMSWGLQAQDSLSLTLAQAQRLAELPLKCVYQEFPNKPSQVLQTADDLGTPKELHPAFYGCFDWHSSVHGHWVLAYIYDHFPEVENRNLILEALQHNITPENIQQELAYFNRKQEYSYERTYGWAWLLKLSDQLLSSPSPELNALGKTLQPLADELSSRYQKYYQKLLYPLRVGTHTNTAFGMTYAYDYAVHQGDDSLQMAIENKAKKLFLKDEKCPIDWEPSGTDFLSPCLEEIDIMMRILPEKEFLSWVKKFLPQLSKKRFTLEVGLVGDRNDGHLVHLDGVNFSRAWVLYRLANTYPKQYNHLKNTAQKHLAFSLPQIVDGGYEGEHWLATFALQALIEKGN